MMTRDDLFKIAKKHGFQKGKKMGKTTKEAIKNELYNYFQTEEGKKALSYTPKVFKPNGEIVPMDVDYAVESILEELEGEK
ncbi:MAG TPA: hypothetical protein DEQ01_06650 [Thermoanaerobacter sp.]|nr:hypothetical protein [Thermoanaerobacter sp.]